MTPEHIALGLTTYVVLLFSLSVHESAHGWMAWKLGDETAMRLGRVSLNPIVHMDPFGTLLFPLIQIFTSVPLLGWAKPTPYNPANFRRDVTMRTGHVLVAAAGPVSNFLLAFLFGGLLVALARAGVDLDSFPATIALMGIQLNVALAVFNLVPIPPLDGSKVASFGLRGDLGEKYDRAVGPYGFVILMLLLMTGALSYVMRPIQLIIFFVLRAFIQ
ncbi:MAG TPA: site-2 protease family protein [Vicinamibacteria bacterium]